MNRARLFSALLGFGLAVLGIARDDRRLIWAAMVALAVALAIRFWSRRRSRPASSDSPPTDH